MVLRTRSNAFYDNGDAAAKPINLSESLPALSVSGRGTAYNGQVRLSRAS